MAIEDSKFLNVQGVKQVGLTDEEHELMRQDSDLTNKTSSLKSIQNSYQNVQHEVDVLSNKLDDLRSISNNVSNDFSQSTNDLKNAVDSIKSIINSNKQLFDNPFDQTSLQSSLSTITDFSNTLRQQIGSIDISKIISDNLSTAIQNSDVEQKINAITSSLQSLLQSNDSLNTFVNSFNDIGKAANTASSNIENLGNSTQRIGSITQEINSKLSNLTSNSQQNVNDVNQFSSTIKEHVDSVNNQSVTVKMLTEQLNDAAKTFEDSESFLSQFFHGASDAVSLDLIDSIGKTINDVKNVTAGNNDNSQKTQYIAESTQQVINQLKELSSSNSNITSSLKNRQLVDSTEQMSNKVIQNLNNCIQVFNFLGSEGYGNVFKNIADQLQQSMKDVIDNVNSSITEMDNRTSALLNNEINNIQTKYTNLGTIGSPERMAANIAVSSSYYDNIPKNINASTSDITGALLAYNMSSGMFQTSQNSPLYKYFNGNFLNDREGFGDDLRKIQASNVGVLSDESGASLTSLIKSYHEMSKDKSGKDNSSDLSKISSTITSLISGTAEDHLTAMSKISLKNGQYGKLNDNDKKTLDGFLASADVTLQTLRNVINAISSVNPEDESLANLRKIYNELDKNKRAIDDIKGKSSDLSSAFSKLKNGVKSAQNLIASGLGIMGLAALAPTLQNLKSFISKGFDFYKEDGQRRYKLARNDAYMGAAINPERANSIIEGMSDYYYKISQGNIGFNEATDYKIAMTRNVGGHYGEGAESAATDMDEITKNTFGLSRLYGLSDQSVSGVMKTYYKDLRMSADDASYMLNSLCQTAISSNVPVEQYVNLVTKLSDSLRSQGIDARQTTAMMGRLMSRNMRVEDAQNLVTGMSTAANTMSKNWAQSAFFGMWAGQGNDPFALIDTGYNTTNADGSINQDYYPAMAQRVIAGANMFSSFGGGPGTSMGRLLMQKFFEDQGMQRPAAAQATNAAANGDTKLLADLMEKADDAKDGGKGAMTKVVGNVNKQLEEIGNQVAATTKAQTSLILAEKKLGENINKYLTGPLETFREGFDKALVTLSGHVETFVSSLAALLNSNAGKEATGLLGEYGVPGLLAAGAVGALAPGALKALGGKVLSNGSKLGQIFSKTGPKQLSLFENASKFGGIGKFAAIAGGAALLAGGGYAAKRLYDMFKNGDGKFRCVNNESKNGGTTPENDSEIQDILNQQSGDDSSSASDDNNNSENDSTPAPSPDSSLLSRIFGNDKSRGGEVTGNTSNSNQNVALDLSEKTDESSSKVESSNYSLVKSNDDRTKKAEAVLNQHGKTMSRLTKDQQDYMDELFNKLKSLTPDTATAASIAAEQTSQLADKQTAAYSQAANEWDNDSGVKGKYFTSKRDDEEYASPAYAKFDHDATYFNRDDGSSDGHQFSDIADALQGKGDNQSGEMGLDGDMMPILFGLGGNPLPSDQKMSIKDYKEMIANNFSYKYGDNKEVDKAIDQLYDSYYKGDESQLSQEDANKYAYTIMHASAANDNSTFKEDAVGRRMKEITNDSTSSTGIQQTAGAATGSGKAPSQHGAPILKNISQIPPVNPYDSANGGGLTYNVDEGTDAFAAGSGKYEYYASGTNDTYSKYGNAAVVTTGNGVKMIYGNLANGNGMENGAAIKAGQSIGTTSDSLNFSVFNSDGKEVDPTQYALNGIKEDSNAGDGTAPQQSNTSKGGPKSIDDVFHDALKNRDSNINELAKLYKTTPDKIKNDKVALGMMVFDGATASGRDSTRMMTPWAVRASFMKNSGEQDTDRYGYSIHGAYTGTGEAQSKGFYEINKEYDEKMMKNTQPIYFGDYNDGNSSAQEAFKEAHDISEQNNKVYEDAQEEARIQHEKELQKNKAEDKKECNITITTVNNGAMNEVVLNDTINKHVQKAIDFVQRQREEDLRLLNSNF